VQKRATAEPRGGETSDDGVTGRSAEPKRATSPRASCGSAKSPPAACQRGPLGDTHHVKKSLWQQVYVAFSNEQNAYYRSSVTNEPRTVMGR
jgi:hypothetical protein